MDERAKYKRNLAILISIAAVVIIGVITAVAVLLINKQKTAKYYEATRRAESCIKEMDYAGAIKEYELALEFDSKQPDAYAKLAVLYEHEGNIAKAKEYAVAGYQNTKSVQLSDFIDSINMNGTTGYTFSEGTSLLVTMESVNSVVVQNMGSIAFKDYISGEVLNKTIDDYISTYGEPDFYADGDYQVADFGDIRVLYPSFVTDVDKAREYLGDPVGIKYKRLSSIFDGVDGDIPFDVACEVLGGTPEIKQSIDGYYYISIEYKGCRVEVECDADGNLKNDANYVFVSAANPYIAADSAATEEDEVEIEVQTQGGSVAGKVKDAVTGSALSNVHLAFRKGNDQKSGEPAAECDTDSSGSYYVELEEGNYCVEIKKSGYIDHYENIQVIKNVSRTGQDLIISTQMAGQIRIVLQWGADPEDLDSYLTGSSDSGTSVNINYRNKSSSVANLDVDDINGYGPETTTIYDVNGVYYFDVQDYNQTGTMASSGAKVTVYLPDNSSQTITINSGLGSTNIWHVLKIDHGELTILNN